MRRDAEVHAAEDEKRHAEVEDRNKADALAFQTEKVLKDAGDKIAAEKKAPVEAALKDLKDALAKNAPIADVKAKQDALTKAMEPVAQEMYAAAKDAGAAQGGASAGAGTPPPHDDSSSSGDGKKDGGDDVVDADFTMK